MKTKVFMTMAALALMATGCNNEDEMDNWNGEIRLTSGIEVQTRATHNLDESLKNGETVHVWVDDAKTPTTTVTTEKLYENNQLTAGSDGALTGDPPMYFPQTGNKVNIYALHTNATWTGNTFPESELTHRVATDQKSSTTTTGGGYQGSDLVFAKKTEVARTSDAVELEFNHLLSKIEVVLVKGAGSPSINKVEILNTRLEAKFTPSQTQNFNATASGDITEKNPIEIDKNLTTATDAKGTDESKKVLNEAIIVPQTLTAGTEFIRITTTEGGVLTYSLSEEKEFAPATKYRYTITANLTELKVTSSISLWGSGEGGTGTAEME